MMGHAMISMAAPASRMALLYSARASCSAIPHENSQPKA